MMDYSSILQSLIDGSAVVITALIGLGVTYIVKYVKSNVANEEFKASLLATTKIIESSVNSSIGNLSKSAKLALADGSISKKELDVIRTNALKHLYEQVSPKLQGRLEAHIGDVKTFLLNQIAEQVEKANKITGV
jgi:hypothetical protein